MAQRVTMTDVAQAAGVSLMTVSRVVNHKDDVSPDTRQRVQDIIHNLGYRPSSIARGLVTQRTGTLGLVVPDIDNPFFSGIVRGAEDEAYARDYSVLLANTSEDPEREIAVLESLEEKQVDGVILCSSRLDEQTLDAVTERFSAVVLISRRLSQDCVATVLIDDEVGGRMATEHLLHSGHRAVGIVTGPAISHSTRERLRGYRLALEAAGLRYRAEWMRSCSPVVQDGYRAVKELLAVHPEITAIFCHNDLVAVGALQVCHELGRQVPDDLALVGYDDIPMASLVTPPLTTCRVSRSELGGQAMRLLLEQIDDCPGNKQQVLIRPELVIRQSAP